MVFAVRALTRAREKMLAVSHGGQHKHMVVGCVSARALGRERARGSEGESETRAIKKPRRACLRSDGPCV